MKLTVHTFELPDDLRLKPTDGPAYRATQLQGEWCFFYGHKPLTDDGNCPRCGLPPTTPTED